MSFLLDVYYWHISTENKLVRGELDYIGADTPKAILKFWRSLPDERFTISSFEGAPSFLSQLQEVRNLNLLRPLLSADAFAIGYIEAIVRECVYFNIYPVKLLFFSLNHSENIDHIKSLMLDFVGLIAVYFKKVSPSFYEDFRDFFADLKREIRDLHESKFHDLTFEQIAQLNVSPSPSSLEWIGSQEQLKGLYEALLVPIYDRNMQIQFLSESTPFNSFKSIFEPNSPSNINWLEITPTNRQPTLASLLLLMEMLKAKKLISNISLPLIRRTIKTHFTNESTTSQTLSNTKVAGSKKTARAKRIIQIVGSL